METHTQSTASTPPYIIAIGGGSGSGKTSVAELLASRLRDTGLTVTIITMDWFYKELPKGADGNNWNWDDPNHFDIYDIDRVLSELKNHDILSELKRKRIVTTPSHDYVEAPGHDYKTYTRLPIGTHKIQRTDVVIFEGIFTLSLTQLHQHYDLKLYIGCDIDVALTRRLRRDVAVRGYNFDIVAERFHTFAKPAFIQYIDPSKKYADLIFENNGKTGIDGLLSLTVIVNHLMSSLGKAQMKQSQNVPSQLTLYDYMKSRNDDSIVNHSNWDALPQTDSSRSSRSLFDSQ